MAEYHSIFTGEQIDERLTAVPGKYTKPEGGIPSTDLDENVQEALNLAASSIQSLADYYDKEQVDAMLASVGSAYGVIAASLPTAGADTLGKVYYIGPTNGEYERYITTYDGSDYDWLDLGSTAIDLTQYATEEEVSQLEHKVDDYWKMPDTQIPVQTVGAHSTYGNYTEQILNKAGAMCTNIAVTPGQVYKLYGTSDSSTYYRIYAIFQEDGTRIARADAGDFTTNPCVVTVPAGGAKMTINLISYNSATDKALLEGEKYNARILQKEIEDNSNAPVLASLNQERAVKMKADRYSSVLADWMQVSSSGASQDNNTVMSVVSSTASTITLSAEDAAHFVVAGPAVVHFPNGNCKMVYFKVPNGNTIEEYAGETTDLTGADYIQNLHDTARGGAGIHLSQLGYIMLAQFTAQEVASKMSQRDSNLLASVMMYNSTESTDKKAVKDVNGNVCATVATDFSTGQFTPNGNGLTAAYGITTDESVNAENFGYLYQAYRFQQGVKDKYITFTLPTMGKGFVEIECGRSPRKPETSTGTATIELYADGTLFDSATVKGFYHRFQFSGVTVKKNISVKFIVDANTDTEVGIYSINFYAMDDIVPAINLTGKKVAVLGDSWTQFPGAANAIPLYPDYNTVVTRPDGTTGDGLGYFPKELARVTGATVDNWGKSNMMADNWGLVMIDTILAFKQYDYLIIEFFTNDVFQSGDLDAWKANITLIAEKCKRACVRPIIALPCRNNGPTINTFGVWHETALRGLGMM